MEREEPTVVQHIPLRDCDLPGGGKGKTVIEYMIRKGWKVDTSAYQILLTKQSNRPFMTGLSEVIGALKKMSLASFISLM